MTLRRQRHTAFVALRGPSYRKGMDSECLSFPTRVRPADFRTLFSNIKPRVHYRRRYTHKRARRSGRRRREHQFKSATCSPPRPLRAAPRPALLGHLHRRARRRFVNPRAASPTAPPFFSPPTLTPCLSRRVRRPFYTPLSTTLTHIVTMPSTSLNCFTLLPVVLLLGGVSPAAGQNNVFANRAALLVARNSSSPSADSTVLGPHE